MTYTGVLTIGVGQSMTFALLAPLGREVGFVEIQIGLIISCSALVFTLTSPVWGSNSDHWGRELVLTLGPVWLHVRLHPFCHLFLLRIQRITDRSDPILVSDRLTGTPKFVFSFLRVRINSSANFLQ
ncbi:MAG: hypothetical protein JRG71_05180 [Deltaproteobacteria bacterium]|nr:hypothetical protein [Deltaproteobacteria bacterium]